MSNIIERKKYVMSNIGHNNNKLWQYTLYDDDTVLCEWGRVGKGLQSKTFSGGKRYAEKKAAEKENKGYREVQTLDSSESSSPSFVSKTNLKKVATEQIKSDCDETQKLIERLTEENAHNIYDATGGQITFDDDSGLFKTPVGIVSLNNIQSARTLLSDLSLQVEKEKWNTKAMERNVEDYLMLVPQMVGRKLTTESFLPDISAIRKQNDILDGLESSYAACIANPPTKNSGKNDTPKLFDVSISLVNDKKDIDKVNKLYGATKQNKHACSHLRIHRVFSIEIASMHLAFQDGSKCGNVKELWHGTRIGNLLSILKGGFVIPPSNSAHCTGRMFGNGTYFSDQSTKALNYAYGYWSGGRSNNCFMFLTKVAMGKSYIPKNSWESLPKPNYNSTFAKAGVSGVINNEMIVYKTNQIDPIYLVEFK